MTCAVSIDCGRTGTGRRLSRAITNKGLHEGSVSSCTQRPAPMMLGGEMDGIEQRKQDAAQCGLAALSGRTTRSACGCRRRSRPRPSRLPAHRARAAGWRRSSPCVARYAGSGGDQRRGWCAAAERLIGQSATGAVADGLNAGHRSSRVCSRRSAIRSRTASSLGSVESDVDEGYQCNKRVQEWS